MWNPFVFVGQTEPKAEQYLEIKGFDSRKSSWRDLFSTDVFAEAHNYWLSPFIRHFYSQIPSLSSLYALNIKSDTFLYPVSEEEHVNCVVLVPEMVNLTFSSMIKAELCMSPSCLINKDELNQSARKDSLITKELGVNSMDQRINQLIGSTHIILPLNFFFLLWLEIFF